MWLPHNWWPLHRVAALAGAIAPAQGRQHVQSPAMLRRRRCSLATQQRRMHSTTAARRGAATTVQQRAQRTLQPSALRVTHTALPQRLRQATQPERAALWCKAMRRASGCACRPPAVPGHGLRAHMPALVEDRLTARCGRGMPAKLPWPPPSPRHQRAQPQRLLPLVMSPPPPPLLQAQSNRPASPPSPSCLALSQHIRGASTPVWWSAPLQRSRQRPRWHRLSTHKQHPSPRMTLLPRRQRRHWRRWRW